MPRRMHRARMLSDGCPVSYRQVQPVATLPLTEPSIQQSPLIQLAGGNTGNPPISGNVWMPGSSPPLASVLMPGGQPVGTVLGGATPEIRTVTPDQFRAIQTDLLAGAPA